MEWASFTYETGPFHLISGFGQTDKRASERASDWVARLASEQALCKVLRTFPRNIASSGKSFGELLVSGGAVSTDTPAETPLPPTVAPTSAGLLQKGGGGLYIPLEDGTPNPPSIWKAQMCALARWEYFHCKNRNDSSEWSNVRCPHDRCRLTVRHA
ncbi:unnamed protein product [Timema podura]|uniref:Uncharacterized protein n=1 Tax=Timema podura TaxID=61482 RepID=A0ABN7NLJ5_TIMPD|nr:unnamed protein product [Timema podura]